MLKTFSAAVLTWAFVGTPDAAARPPTIEPAEVNTRNIGSCETYDPNDPYNLHNGAGANSLRPLGAIYAYVQSYQKAYVRDSKPTDYSVKFIVQPQNGVIKNVSDENGTRDLYIPNPGYTGNDRYVAEVTLKGVKFRVAGYIRPSNDVMSGYDELCHRLGLPSSAWKISDATDSNTGDLPWTMSDSLASALGGQLTKEVEVN
ncbi:MAG: hypothetical protein WA049_12945 [Ferribacterium limneticum]